MGFRKAIDPLKKSQQQQPQQEQQQPPPPPPGSDLDKQQAESEAKHKPTVESIREDDFARAAKDPDHPVHKIPIEKQEKMLAKGVNPVLKAEMDQATKGKKGFRLFISPFGGGSAPSF